ncbi:MAG: hypothetical protein ACFFAN_17515 [Promethearchaeota archaeon]
MKERETISITKDIKVSFIFAKRNLLSYFLAMLGLLVLLTLAIVAVAVPLGLAISYGPWSQGAAETQATADLLIITILGMTIAIAVFTFLLLVLGGIFGMSKEIIEVGKSHAEKPFSTIKNKFVPLVMGSFLLTLILLGVPLLIGGLVSWGFGWTIPQILSWILGAIFLAWIFIIGGFLAMVFPSIVDGKGLMKSISESIKKAKSHPGRIFGVRGIFTAIWIGVWIPIILWGLLVSPDVNPIASMWIAIYAPVVVFILIFFILPAENIALTRIYNDLEGKPLADL